MVSVNLQCRLKLAFRFGQFFENFTVIFINFTVIFVNFTAKFEFYPYHLPFTVPSTLKSRVYFEYQPWQFYPIRAFLDQPQRSFKLTGVHSSVRSSVTNFSRDWLISFFWHKGAKWQCVKSDGARFSKEIFFRPKMPEICRKNRSFGIFSRFHNLFF